MHWSRKEQVQVSTQNNQRKVIKYVWRRTCKPLGAVVIELNIHNPIPRQGMIQDLPDQVMHD